MAGVVKGVAAMQGIPVRWGGDWNGDGDGNLFDSNFDDLPHFEIL
jgi:peptidoglycan L-alanyl-D-glutamate endopeptidase CwlK